MATSTRAAVTLATLMLIGSAALAASPKAAKRTKAAPTAAAPEAAAEQAPVALTEGQLEAAGRVYTGEAQCEFGERVHLAAVEGRPGHFTLSHKKARYTLVPEETTTGAVRLEDRRAGIVWLQIPAKSMLMNARLGQRMIDYCLHAEQRTAAAPTTAMAIGIAATKP